MTEEEAAKPDPDAAAEKINSEAWQAWADKELPPNGDVPKFRPPRWGIKGGKRPPDPDEMTIDGI
ncbi:MAG: hypothetical protein ACREN8_00250 [Candidatus Dormibacteraceae bacterium]